MAKRTNAKKPPALDPRPDAHAEEAESTLLACLLENNAWIEQCGVLADHPDWFSVAQRLAAAVIFDMIQSGQEANETSIIDEVRRRHEAQTGDVLTLADVMAMVSARDVVSPGSVSLYAEQIIGCERERHEWDWAQKTMQAGARFASPLEMRQLLADEEADLAQFTDTAQTAPPSLGVCLADVEVEEFDWVWRGRIARRKLTMVDGNPGLGKSLVTLDIGARILMGDVMPDGSPGLGQPAGVVIVCGEDGLADTVKPRLLAAGASPDALRRAWAVNLVPERLANGDTSERMLSLVTDLPILEAKIIETGAAVLIVDPVTAYLGSQTDMYKDSHVRAVLTPLALMAERTGVAVLLVRHLNKNIGVEALHRGLGGVGFIGVARLGMLFAENPNAEGERLVGRHKGNIGAAPPTWAYRVRQVGESDNMVMIEWLGQRDIKIEAALAAQPGIPGVVDKAVDFLRDELRDGDVPTNDLMDRGKILRFSESALNRAKKRLGLKAKKKRIGDTDQWVWPQIPQEDTQECQESQESQENQGEQETDSADTLEDESPSGKSVTDIRLGNLDTVDALDTLAPSPTLPA
jgi:hypothetical protein